MVSIVGKRYGNALFSLALDSKQIDEIKENTTLMIETFKGNSDFNDVISHPRISNEEKIKLIKSVFQDNLHESMEGTINLLANKGRITNLIEILEVYEKLVKEHNNIIDAKIISATLLSKEKVEEIAEKLSKNLNKNVQVEVEVDQTLIGGLLIQVDGRIIDGTIDKRLKNIKEGLLNNTVSNF